MSPAARPYVLYGVRILSELPMPAPETSVPRPSADLLVRRIVGGGGEPPPGPAVYASPGRAADGEPAVQLVLGDGFDLLRIAGLADFEIADREIRFRLLDQGAEEVAGIHLLGTALALWLERRGVPCLHASAVVLDGGAVAFASSNRGGKSSLAAALVRRGLPLLTDDVLPLEATEEGLRARPGYPQMRFWPEEAEHFLGGHRHLPRVHPGLEKRRASLEDGRLGSFSPEPRPLARLYLPERSPPDAARGISIEPVCASDALIELVRRSFLPRLTEAAGWQSRRLALFADLVESVPVRRLRYPSGYECLERVAEAVLADA